MRHPVPPPFLGKRRAYFGFRRRPLPRSSRNANHVSAREPRKRRRESVRKTLFGLPNPSPISSGHLTRGSTTDSRLLKSRAYCSEPIHRSGSSDACALTGSLLARRAFRLTGEQQGMQSERRISSEALEGDRRKPPNVWRQRLFGHSKQAEGKAAIRCIWPLSPCRASGFDLLIFAPLGSYFDFQRIRQLLPRSPRDTKIATFSNPISKSPSSHLEYPSSGPRRNFLHRPMSSSESRMDKQCLHS